MTSRAHFEWSFISPFSLLPFYSLPACVHGDLLVCFAFLAILFQLPDNPFSPPLDLHVGVTYSWDDAVILAAALWATFCCFLDHQLRLMKSRSLNSILTDWISPLFIAPKAYRVPGLSSARFWLLKQNKHPGSARSAGEIHWGRSLVPYLGRRQSWDWFSPNLHMCFLSRSHAFTSFLQPGSCKGWLLGDALSSTKSSQLGGRGCPPQTAGIILFVFLLFLVITRTWIKVNIIEKGAPADTIYGFFSMHLFLPESGKWQRVPEVAWYFRKAGMKLKGVVSTAGSGRLLPGSI